ncbi:MAG: hypothetical protein E6Q40_11455 [Cupriavidus sp.]|nr:MAG: hypothetical protein E6Q40_11455 [Cupriavidus sp.]
MKEYELPARRVMEEARRAALQLHRGAAEGVIRAAVVDRLAQLWGITREDLTDLYEGYGLDREVLVESAAFRCTDHFKQHVVKCLPALFRGASVEPVAGGDLIIAAVQRKGAPVALVRGAFGRSEFLGAMREASERGFNTTKLYVVADVCTYTGPSIGFTKLEELPNYAYTQDEAYVPTLRVIADHGHAQATDTRQKQLLADAAALLEQLKLGAVRPSDEVVSGLIACIDGVLPADHRIAA